MTIKTRILILSDTHAALPRRASASEPLGFSLPFPNSDVVLHAGDLTMTGQPKEHRAAVELLTKCDAPLKLAIAGNHDLTLDDAYVAARHPNERPYFEQDAAEAKAIWSSDEAQKTNVKLLEEGLHRFVLQNGAVLTLQASPQTPAFYDWAFMYARDKHPFGENAGAASPATFPHSPDVLITHGPPATHLGQVHDGKDAGCEGLLGAVRRARPLLHCFGHIHESHGARVLSWPSPSGASTASTTETAVHKVELGTEAAAGEKVAHIDCTSSGPADTRLGQKGERTLLVNASIMDLRYAPVQAPFLVELDLPEEREAVAHATL